MNLQVGDKVRSKKKQKFGLSDVSGTLVQIGTISDCCYVKWDGFPTRYHEKLRDLIAIVSVEERAYKQDFIDKIKNRIHDYVSK